MTPDRTRLSVNRGHLTSALSGQLTSASIMSMGHNLYSAADVERSSLVLPPSGLFGHVAGRPRGQVARASSRRLFPTRRVRAVPIQLVTAAAHPDTSCGIPIGCRGPSRPVQVARNICGSMKQISQFSSRWSQLYRP
jgi:hypothetical protein